MAGYSQTASEVIDHDREDGQLAVSEHTHRNLRTQSFVDRYGVEEPHLSSIDHVKHYFKKQCASFSFICCLNKFLDKIPLIRCLTEYNIRKNLFGDIIAGITVAIMHIPQGTRKSFLKYHSILSIIIGMAYGVLTTLPPIHGNHLLVYFD
jgi:hypothetical protein